MANATSADLESPPDSPGVRLRVQPKGVTLKCYYEGCEENALYPCVAIGCCKDYGCGQGICATHCSKKIVQYDRYGKPPKFCTNCEPVVLKWLWINTCVPFGVFLFLLTGLLLLITLHYNGTKLVETLPEAGG